MASAPPPSSAALSPSSAAPPAPPRNVRAALQVRYADWLAAHGTHADDPVVIVGYPRSGEFIKRCRKDELLAYYRNTSIVLSSANTFSYANRFAILHHTET